MNIAFDAKRAFRNESGLGNYARTLIKSLIHFYPENNYSLFTTSRGNEDFYHFLKTKNQISVIQPTCFLEKKFSSYWRSFQITDYLIQENINVYHGLSNELPFNIHKFQGKKIVTIHDLLFLRYPELYPLIDRKIYDRKFKTACLKADIIVAISEQTKQDIIDFYSITPAKIRVIYQSCDPIFNNQPDMLFDRAVIKKYNLPSQYLLYVGTIEERKNLLALIHALNDLRDIPLVVIGKKREYFKKVSAAIKSLGLEKSVFFPEQVLHRELPAIYRQAQVFVYPSIFEGFGIPVVESLSCGTPVVTSLGSCFKEAGGPDTLYVNPQNPEEISTAINSILTDSFLSSKMKVQGLKYIQRFSPSMVSQNMMSLYMADS